MTYNVFSGTLNPTHFTSPLAYPGCPRKEAVQWVSVLVKPFTENRFL